MTLTLPVCGADYSENGFALLDAMVALAIIAVMSALLFQTIGSTVMAKRHITENRHAILIAQSRLAELQTEYTNSAIITEGRDKNFVWRATVEPVPKTALENSRGLEQISITVSNSKTSRQIVTLRSIRLAR